MADQREWLSPYSYVQNNPLLRVDPDGMLDDYYNREGQFLYRDNQETDNIRIIEQKDFESIQQRFLGDMYDQSTYNNDLIGELGSRSVGINQAKLSAESASNIFTDILSKTDGVDISKLHNGKVSVYMGDRGFGDPVGANEPERASGVANTAVKGVTSFLGNASDGTIKVTANFTGQKSSYLSTVSNVQNALGAHEFQGHGEKQYHIGGGPHYKAYELQKGHQSWEGTTDSFKSYMEGNYKREKNQ
jgi:hypothetical protein